MRLVWLLVGLLACGEPEGVDEPVPSTPPVPGTLEVGVARARMPVPVGIGTAGFGGFLHSADPSPFAELYPATTRMHTHPDVRAMVISRGEGFEAIFLRVDMVGIFQQIRENVLVELEARLGRDLDDALILAATHTHAGPGRVLDVDGPFELITDRFHPEFYRNLIHVMADTVEAAYADLEPGRLGFATGYTEDPIQDRRCEDGLYENGTLPLVAVERQGELAGVLMAYPIHGTVISLDHLTLSQDVSGSIEAAVEDRLGGEDGPILAMMVNSWGADMRPSEPARPLQAGPELPSGFQRIEAVGQAMADAVEEAAGALQFTDAPEIHLRTHRMPIDREVLAYADDEFTFPYGATFCGTSLQTECDAQTNHYPHFDDSCLPFPRDYPAPMQTVMTAGRLGPLALLTFPGEPGTLLAEHIVDQLLEREVSGVEGAMFIGYAQDHLGYSLLEEDYWLGGYEASSALWGPRQGEYLADRAVAAYDASLLGGQPLSELEPLDPFRTEGFEAYVPSTPLDFGEVVSDVQPVYSRTEIATFTVAGADPWLGTPIVELIDESGAPVTRPGGVPIHSDGPAMWIDLLPEPPYTEALWLAERRFLWTVSLPLSHRVVGVGPELDGAYRLRVRLQSGDGEQQVLSGLFVVEE